MNNRCIFFCALFGLFSTYLGSVNLAEYFSPEAADFPAQQKEASTKAKKLIAKIGKLHFSRTEEDLFKAAHFLGELRKLVTKFHLESEKHLLLCQDLLSIYDVTLLRINDFHTPWWGNLSKQQLNKLDFVLITAKQPDEKIKQISNWLKNLIKDLNETERINDFSDNNITVEIDYRDNIRIKGIPQELKFLRIFLLALGIDLEDNNG